MDENHGDTGMGNETWKVMLKKRMKRKTRNRYSGWVGRQVCSAELSRSSSFGFRHLLDARPNSPDPVEVAAGALFSFSSSVACFRGWSVSSRSFLSCFSMGPPMVVSIQSEIYNLVNFAITVDKYRWVANIQILEYNPNEHDKDQK